jgi:A/G-specific adenine glycosylase
LNKQSFRQSLLSWYNLHKRDLPWRKSNDPYIIWISEIILQQTRVNQGLPYFQKFAKNYPTVFDLANAPEEAVMKDWEGLGYYSRARNLHTASKQIVREYGGLFPDTYKEILKLKGVGSYTAAAISAFAYNEAQAVVDGNVYRVLARVYGIDTPINSTAGKKQFESLAKDLLYTDDPAAYNQAIMEFGALQCIPKGVDCTKCPFQNGCYARMNNRVGELPVKKKKVYQRDRYFNYIYITSGDNIVVELRTANDIWKKLYQFPLVEAPALLSFDEVWQEQSQWLSASLNIHLTKVNDLPPHKLSHQTIYCRVFEVEVPNSEELKHNGSINLVEKGETHNLGFPRPLRKFLDRKQLTLPL